MQDQQWICVVSSFRCEVDKICPLLEYYAAYSGKCLSTFLLILVFFLDFLTLEDGTDKLSRNNLVFFPGFLDA